ncbi:MAG TPA: hypothetical protein VFB99_01135, partial [Vicinamibacterales bacterium]|nr:hypothetical protein [Vicinamibacterales bacterium]
MNRDFVEILSELSAAGADFLIVWRDRRSRCRGVLAEPHTSGQRSGIRRPLRRQSEREDSPPTKFGFCA